MNGVRLSENYNRLVGQAILFVLLVWTRSEKDEWLFQLGYRFMTLAFLGMLLLECSTTGCFRTKGSL